jgi:hypothetical protein
MAPHIQEAITYTSRSMRRRDWLGLAEELVRTTCGSIQRSGGWRPDPIEP